MLNWIVWNRTDYSYKKGVGIKYAIKPKQPTNQQECCEQYWTSSGGNTLQNSSCTANYHPFRKLSKLDLPDMRDTAGEVKTNKWDILRWTPSHGWAKAGQPGRTYIQQLCTDTGYSLENLLRALEDRESWREWLREIRAGSVISWTYVYVLKS